jgi:ubiquinone/menaquinone biosynthesis C-methylase UbiE
MDDRHFDEQTAIDWIKAIERPGISWRDDHVYSKLNLLIREAAPRAVIDIGCGQGVCSDKVDLSRCRYAGVEPSPFLLERAKELYQSAGRTFLSGNAYDLPVPNQSFDLAFSILVWHLLMDLEKASSEMGRVMNKNGKFFLVTANPDSYPAWQRMYFDSNLTGKRFEGTMRLGDALSRDVLFLHTWDEIEQALTNSGLRIDRSETFLTSKVDPKTNLLISIEGTRGS